MDGSEARDGGGVDEDERGYTEEHEDRDVVAELAAEIHDAGNSTSGLIKTTCNLPSLISESDLARSILQ